MLLSTVPIVAPGMTQTRQDAANMAALRYLLLLSLLGQRGLEPRIRSASPCQAPPLSVDSATVLTELPLLQIHSSISLVKCAQAVPRVWSLVGVMAQCTARPGDDWNCLKGEPESDKNTGNTVAIMRVIDLLA